MHYFIGRQGSQLGPFTAHQVREQLAAGVISYDDLVWHEGMTEWRPVRTLFAPPGSPPPMPGSAFAPAGSPFRSEVTREPPPEGPRLADRGTRLLARIIDTGLVFAALAPGLIWFFSSLANLPDTHGDTTTNVEGHTEYVDASHASEHAEAAATADMLGGLGGAMLLSALLVLVLIVVQTVLLSSHGQTLGKRWLKIRIVRVNGEPAGFAHAVLLRIVLMGLINALVGIVSLIDPLFIFREDRRCLHDLIADTTVIDA